MGRGPSHRPRVIRCCVRRRGVRAGVGASTVRWVLAAIPLLSGCATVGANDVFHALHMVDVGQTMNSVSLGPCHEADTITSALIGREPNVETVAAWGLAVAISFEWVRAVLPERWVPWFEWASVAAKAVTVIRNEHARCGL